MITCNFFGGLGNNLFQLACLYNIHKKYNIDYYISKNVDRKSVLFLNQSLELELEDIFENKFVYGEKLNHKEYYHKDMFNSFSYHDIPIDDNICYNGYFQSEKYFSDFNIKEEFKLKKNIALLNKNKNLFDKPTIALHYRLAGDKVKQEVQFYHKNISPEFYKKSLEIIFEKENKKQEDYNILVFSDNLEMANNLLKTQNINYHLIENSLNPSEEFILMSLCNHNIIGNSTFSWWSAYLNKNNNKIVVCPKTEWFGIGYSNYSLDDLFPKQWIKL